MLLLLYFYHLYVGYLQLHTRNKSRFQGIQCCSYSVFTICTTCNVISPIKYVLYFYINNFSSTCAVYNMVVLCISLIQYFLGMLLMSVPTVVNCKPCKALSQLRRLEVTFKQRRYWSHLRLLPVGFVVVIVTLYYACQKVPQFLALGIIPRTTVHVHLSVTKAVWSKEKRMSSNNENKNNIFLISSI